VEFVTPQAEPGLSIVLPAYNEELNLEVMVERCLEIIPRITSMPFEVVGVNDGSSDQTGPRLERLAARYPLVKALHHPHNLGCGQALLTGFRHTRYQCIFYSDADLQFDLGDLQRFLPYVADYDLILGYRLARQDPWHRRLFAYSWKRLLYLLFHLNVRDINCGFRLIKREVLAPMEIESMGAMFFAEFLIKAISGGAKYIEIGVNHYPRGSGKPTGGNPRVVARAFKEMFRFFWRWHLTNGRHPKKSVQPA
jgi:glycosyltransferase involved in cell wall biosynthesis